ncbi:MAG: hypothetical protein KC609_08490, partial [Myxococcales bacterium]|nr:hypothetical protein [Myxococcales bacterium]
MAIENGARSSDVDQALSANFDELLARLGGDARAEALPAIERLERAFGVTLTSRARAYYALYGERHVRALGELLSYDESAFRLPDAERGNLFERALREPLLAVSAFTGCVCLGSDGAGQDYFLNVTAP